MKRILSKSSINQYLQCPLKWKYIYIDNIKSEPSPAQERGIEIHEKIENFYKKLKLIKKENIPEIEYEVDIELDNFIELERKRIKRCVNEKGEFDLKYFKPLFQELKLQDEKLGFKGIIDAIYINSKDEGIIIMDWKTGRFDKDKLDDYRLELAVYAELLRTSNKVDNIKYWGLYFIDQDKLFFEQIELKYIKKMYDIVNEVRQDIEQEKFEPKRNVFCKFCQFKERCFK
jgi:CRISPR/Cas system-associated exonuclease Cas4 (RecB family)